MSKQDKGGELSKPLQINPASIKQSVNESLLNIRGQVEAQEAEVVDAVLGKVLPTFLDDLQRTSSDRITKLMRQRTEEQAGLHLANFRSELDQVTASIAHDICDQVIPELLAI